MAALPTRIEDQPNSKFATIEEACEAADVETLGRLAISDHGLVNDSARCKAWSLLLGCHDEGEPVPWVDLPIHRDEAQVRLDVDRSFVYYPKGEDDGQLKQRKDELYNVIIEVLRRYPFLCYFQGFHDIAQVFLLVLGPDKAAAAVARLSLLRIRDFMLPSLSGAIAHLQLLPHIIRAADPVLEKHVSATQPFFALASTLTLYAHDIEDYADIARLFDFLLASEASMSLYLFASIILSRRDELLAVEADEADMLHFVLSKLPRPLHLESLISDAISLFRQHPPKRLAGNPWRLLDRNSVLVTTQDPNALRRQTNHDGHVAFDKQVKSLRRSQAIHYARKQVWKYRRPAGIGLAIAVAILSAYVRRSNGIHDFWRIFRVLSSR